MKQIAINVKSNEQIVNNFRALSTEDLLARATKPHSYVGNKWFAVEGEPGVSATAEFHVLDVRAIAGKENLYRVTYKGIFFELGNGSRCLIRRRPLCN